MVYNCIYLCVLHAHQSLVALMCVCPGAKLADDYALLRPGLVFPAMPGPQFSRVVRFNTQRTCLVAAATCKR